MREDYRLLTPENVELSFDVAGLGSRLAAAIIDYLIIGCGYLAVILAAAFVSSLVQRIAARVSVSREVPALADAAGYAMLAGGFFLAFVAWWGYFLLFEMLWGGQSPGKRMFGLRVVRRDGQPLSFTATLVRSILRWIDQAMLLGVFVMLIDRFSRRFGDLAAGTFVIRDPQALRARALEVVEIPAVAEDRIQALPNAGRITMGHYTLIRDYFGRSHLLHGSSADDVAARMATGLARELEVDPSAIGPPVAFLATVARAYEDRHRYSETAPLT